MVGEEAVTRTAACYRALLRSCGRRGPPSLRQGQKLHAQLLTNGHLSGTGAGSISSSSIPGVLFHMYAACGSPATALRVFLAVPLPQRNIVDWTALLSCHFRHGLYADVLRLYRFMELEGGMSGDEVTMVCVLGACARLRDLVTGAGLHLQIVKRGLLFHVAARNAVMDVYAKCGWMVDARKLFDETATPTVVSWTVILSGALRWEGLESGRRVFHLMGEQKNEVAWTVMVSGCIEAGYPRDALSLIAHMLFDSHCTFDLHELNHITLCSFLSACAQAGDLTTGRWVHAYYTKITIAACNDARQVMVNTALIDMYAKCGKIGVARSLFETLTRRNIVTWNAILSGLAMHGLARELLLLFSRMVDEEQIWPDEITFVSVLCACSRSGLVDEGRRHFLQLEPVFGIVPQVEHYACMVDLLGRAGSLEEATALVRSMPMPPNEVVLGSLLASCSLHGRTELGQHLLEELVQLDPRRSQYHVLLSNAYASSGNQVEAEALRQELSRRGVRKAPGISYINVDGYIHRFCAGDKAHPRTPEIYAMLDEMTVRLRSAGYTADGAVRISRVMDSYLGDDDEREQALITHGERLAIAFGMISTRPGSALLIMKNIRVCVDCHSAIKLISRIYGREITIRDRNRFHCFKQGTCSCSDYW